MNTYSLPEFLTVEDITFVSCLEEDLPIRNSLLCLDDNSFKDLEVTKWSSGNCYLSSYNLEEFECDRLVLQGEYVKDGENYKLKKSIRVNKLTTVLDKLVDSQFSDGGWKDPLSTAYAVWALSYFKEIYSYELDQALDWLKLNRNEEKKCWPKSPCNVELSSNILSLLTLSNYTDAKRVVNDARNWMEELQNDYSQGETWTVTAKAVSDNTTLSLVSYDQTILDENFTLPTNDAKTYDFKAYTDKELMIISDDNILINVSNNAGEVLLEFQGDNLSYTTPGACWSLNRRGEPCDKTTTLFAMTTPIDETQKDLAKEWVRGEVRNGEVLGKYFGDKESVIDTDLYVYNLYSDDSSLTYMDQMLDWITYNQNNEGSWDSGTIAEKAIPTADSLVALLKAGFNRTSEQVEDAEYWASENEDNLTTNQTSSLASIFYILKHNARPLLYSTPKIIFVDQEKTSLDLHNPTTFNLRELEYKFSSNIEDYVEIGAKDEIDAYSYRKLIITRKKSDLNELYGYLSITNNGDEIAKIPVILTDTPTLKITSPESYTVFGTKEDIPLTITKSAHEFVCNVNWKSNEISTPGTFRIRSEEMKLPIVFSEALTKEDVYTGTISCTAGGKKQEEEISIYIKRFSSVPLTITPTDIIANSTKDISFTLKNNLDQDLTVDISMDRYSNYFGFRTQVPLDPNEEYNLTLTNKLPLDLNLTSTALMEFKVFDRTEVASILIDISVEQSENKGFMKIILYLIIPLIVIGSTGFVIWKFREIIFKELNKLTFWKIKTEKKKEIKKIKTLKTTEEKQAIINMYKIMKMQNKDDKEIASRLVANFDSDSIKFSLETIGAALPVLDEEEPEKA